jgi:hypothetical protein
MQRLMLLRSMGANKHKLLSLIQALLLSGLLLGRALAHPFPELPVIADFLPSGHLQLRVVVDPRCFNEDPNTGPYVTKSAWDPLTTEQKAAKLQQAADLVRSWVEFQLQPGPSLQPQFQFSPTSLEEKPLSLPEDPLFFSGVWELALPAKASTWSIRTTAEPKVSVVLNNLRAGETLKRFAVLFPSEQSFQLQLAELPNLPLATRAELAAQQSDGDHEPETEAELPPLPEDVPTFPVMLLVAIGAGLLLLLLWKRRG